MEKHTIQQFLIVSCILCYLIHSTGQDKSKSITTSLGYEFVPVDISHPSLLTVTVKKRLHCCIQCHEHLDCRTFDYDATTNICRLWDVDVISTGSIRISSTKPQSSAGMIQYSAENYRNIHNQSCDKCVGSRYEICDTSTNRCRCPLKTFWNGSMCLAQLFRNQTCSSNNSCRSDLNLTCQLACDLTYRCLDQPICTPFWKMPLFDQGTNLTYKNANTKVSGDKSRSGCIVFRTSTITQVNILFEIGSSLTTWDNNTGCNTHFALALMSSNYVSVFGMCNAYDNSNIYLGQSNLLNGEFHQLCVTYENTTDLLCIYHNLVAPVCIVRSNPPYNTSLGDVRIGWWPDDNWSFDASGGGLLRSVSLFDMAINGSCVSHIYHTNFC